MYEELKPISKSTEQDVEKVVYEQRLVAFLDILGFSDLIDKDANRAKETIILIDKTIQHVVDCIRDTYNKEFSIKLFSDCFCISCCEVADNIEFMLRELAFMHFYFSCEGIFLRGALSIGLHFENDRMIYSQGLVNAYELAKLAVYPRTIIDRKVIDSLRPDNEYVMVAPDGLYTVDYLLPIFHEYMDSEMIEGFFEEHKTAIIKQVETNHSNAPVMEKYRWLAQYHNRKFHEVFTPEEGEEEDYRKLADELVINMGELFPDFMKPSRY